MRHWDYPPHFMVRLVSKNGGFRWSSKRVPLTHTLENEYIGLEEIDDGIYNVYYCDYLIGRFFEEILSVKDVIERVPIRLRKAKECYPCP